MKGTDDNALCAKTIKDLRMKLCMTQKELGEAIGIGSDTISKYELCRHMPGLPVIRRIIKLANSHHIKLTITDFREC